jgi:multidrug efflux pump subunit AcrA (membrane-fusion protein)
MASGHKRPHDAADQDWLEFESLLGELAAIARSGMPFEPFVKLLLEKTVHILAAPAGAVWLGEGRNPLRLECQIRQDAVNGMLSQRFHQHVLECARSEAEPIVVPPGGTTIGSQTLPNPSDHILLVGPLKLDQDVVGLFEVVQRGSTSAAAIRGNRRLIGLVCELASDHLRRRELRQLRDERRRSAQLEDFTQRIHATLDLKAVAYEVANAGCQFIGCDRLSVAIRKGRRQVLTAISSLDTINRRSNVVRGLEKLAARVVKAGETVWYDGESSEDLPPQIAEILRQYSDDAHPRMIGVIPLHLPEGEERRKRRPALGTVIVEQFNSVLDASARQRAEQVAGQSSLALLNSLRYRALPTLPFARYRSRVTGQPIVRIWTAVASVAAAALVASMFLIQADFDVYAEGELQPEAQQQVFAPFDSQVASIAVKHGDQVKANAVLLELRSRELDLESQRIQGEFDTTQKRISAIESSLLELNVKDDPDETRFSQLAAEQEELKQSSASKREQLALLRQQRDELVVRSPIAGQVVTWDLEQLLSDRPVQRGQLLLNVADLDGSWVAELEVPDDHIGHVLNATEHRRSLTATFQLATNRGVDYQGEIRRISSRTETSDDQRPIVRVTVDVDEKNLPELRPGATILAKIHCGRRTLAFVWFHEVVEAVLRWLRF